VEGASKDDVVTDRPIGMHCTMQLKVGVWTCFAFWWSLVPIVIQAVEGENARAGAAVGGVG
jgi:hypothetical protein